jgi:hypothetical protein
MGKIGGIRRHFCFFPMEGYFLFTARSTLAFSAEVPDCETRDNAFLACDSFSIGYFRSSGSAKDLAGSDLRPALESFAIGYLTSELSCDHTPTTPLSKR